MLSKKMLSISRPKVAKESELYCCCPLNTDSALLSDNSNITQHHENIPI